MRNWVKARHECTREAVFNAIYTQVQNDVGTANEASVAGSDKFEVVERTHTQANAAFAVRKKSGSDGKEVLFMRLKLEIQITHPEKGSFTIKPTWNPLDLSCDLHISGEDQPYKIWQISQYSLSTLFFGSEDSVN